MTNSFLDLANFYNSPDGKILLERLGRISATGQVLNEVAKGEYKSIGGGRYVKASALGNKDYSELTPAQKESLAKYEKVGNTYKEVKARETAPEKSSEEPSETGREMAKGFKKAGKKIDKEQQAQLIKLSDSVGNPLGKEEQARSNQFHDHISGKPTEFKYKDEKGEETTTLLRNAVITDGKGKVIAEYKPEDLMKSQKKRKEYQQAVLKEIQSEKVQKFLTWSTPYLMGWKKPVDNKGREITDKKQLAEFENMLTRQLGAIGEMVSLYARMGPDGKNFAMLGGVGGAGWDVLAAEAREGGIIDPEKVQFWGTSVKAARKLQNILAVGGLGAAVAPYLDEFFTLGEGKGKIKIKGQEYKAADVYESHQYVMKKIIRDFSYKQLNKEMEKGGAESLDNLMAGIPITTEQIDKWFDGDNGKATLEEIAKRLGGEKEAKAAMEYVLSHIKDFMKKPKELDCPKEMNISAKSAYKIGARTGGKVSLLDLFATGSMSLINRMCEETKTTVRPAFSLDSMAMEMLPDGCIELKLAMIKQKNLEKAIKNGMKGNEYKLGCAMADTKYIKAIGSSRLAGKKGDWRIQYDGLKFSFGPQALADSAGDIATVSKQCLKGGKK